MQPPKAPVQVFAGVPLAFGVEDASAEWTFGDGSRPARGAEVKHAFARAGDYVVRARVGDDELLRQPVTVVPRPVLQAIPPGVSSTIFIPKVRGTLEPAVDFVERAFGRLGPSRTSGREPFFIYAVELSGGPPPEEWGLDPEEGLATFQFSQSPHLVTTVGIVDEPRALNTAAELLAQRGFQLRSNRELPLEFRNDAGQGIWAFVDRGYLYFVSDDAPPNEDGDVSGVMERIRTMPAEGLSGERLEQLLQQVQAGAAYLYLAGTSQQTSVLASLRISPDRLELDGVLTSSEPIWRTDAAPQIVPLASEAVGPVLAASVSLDPLSLAQLLVQSGLVPSTRTPEEVRALAEVLRGDLAVLGYFDAAGTVKRMTQREGFPEVSATVVLHAGIRDRAAAEKWLERTLQANEVLFERRAASDAVAYRFVALGRAGVAEVTADRLFVEVGPALTGRPGVALAQTLQRVYGDAAFSRGHLSAVADLGQVLRELEQAAPGEDDAKMLRGFASEFLQQLTAIQTVFVDVAPDPLGARLTGRIELRPVR